MSEQNVDTTQRQIQEQKVKFHGGTGHWIGEVMKWGFLFFLVVVLVMVGIWVFGGENGQYTDLVVCFVVAAIALYFIYHLGQQQKYKTYRAMLDSHFHDVSPFLSIGDRATEGYIPYFIPQGDTVVEAVKDEPLRETLPMNAAPIRTLSQEREKVIQDYYEDGKTMQQIVDAMKHSSVFDAPSMHDVRKALGKTGKEKKEGE